MNNQYKNLIESSGYREVKEGNGYFFDREKGLTLFVKNINEKIVLRLVFEIDYLLVSEKEVFRYCFIERWTGKNEMGLLFSQ